ncbi:RNA-binding domain-containing protein [Atractiella rhizophila]|nr:RNA-binding domain-containing protein [Atractiella rhizophila]
MQQWGPPNQQKRAHLYVGNLSPRVTEFMLQEIFSVAGAVLGVKIIPDRTFQHGGLNYGFVEYHEMRAAETALQTLNGRKIFDTEIRVNWAYQNQTAKEDLTNHFHVFVGDLSPEVNDEVLHKAFSAFPSLSDARVMWDMNTGKSRGYGFLAFRDKADAEQGIATMNGEWLGSRAIRVNWANQKNQGGPTGAGPGMPMGGGGGGAMPGVPTGPRAGAAPMQSYAQPSYDQGAGAGPAFNNTTIYVGNLVPYTTQNDLIPLFQGYGYIVEIRMQSDRGFAFVKLDSHENAANAIVSLNGTMVHNRPLKCSWGRDRMGTEPAGTGPPPQQPQMPNPAVPASYPNAQTMPYATQAYPGYTYPSYAGYPATTGAQTTPTAPASAPGADPNAAATAAAWGTPGATDPATAAYYAYYYQQQAAAQAAAAQQQGEHQQPPPQ